MLSSAPARAFEGPGSLGALPRSGPERPLAPLPLRGQDGGPCRGQAPGATSPALRAVNEFPRGPVEKRINMQSGA